MFLQLPLCCKVSSLYLLWKPQKSPAWPGELGSSPKPLSWHLFVFCLARAPLLSSGPFQSRSRRLTGSQPPLTPPSHDPCQTTGNLEQELLRRKGTSGAGHISKPSGVFKVSPNCSTNWSQFFSGTFTVGHFREEWHYLLIISINCSNPVINSIFNVHVTLKHWSESGMVTVTWTTLS